MPAPGITPQLPAPVALGRFCWRSCVVSWSRRFDEPIELPGGRKLKTLAEAMAWLAKEIPKSEHKMEKVQNAAHLVTRAVEHGGPMIFAQMGMLQAIHRHHKRDFKSRSQRHTLGAPQASAGSIVIGEFRCGINARKPAVRLRRSRNRSQCRKPCRRPSARTASP